MDASVSAAEAAMHLSTISSQNKLNESSTTLFSLPLPLIAIILTDQEAIVTTGPSSMIAYERQPAPGQWVVKSHQPTQQAFYQTCRAAREIVRSMPLSAGLIINTLGSNSSGTETGLSSLMKEQLSFLPIGCETFVSKLEVKVLFKATGATHSNAPPRTNPQLQIPSPQNLFDLLWSKSSFISQFPNINTLSLYIHGMQSKVTLASEQLGYLAQAFPSLRSLSIDSDSLALSSVSSLTQLQFLKVSCYGGYDDGCFNDLGLSSLGSLTGLKSLYLNEKINFVASELVKLSSLQSLSIECLVFNEIKEASTCLAMLSSLNRLTHLSWGDANDDPPGDLLDNEETLILAESIASITSLVSLELHLLNLHPQSVAILSAMPSLTSIKGLWEINARSLDPDCEWKELSVSNLDSPASAWALSILPMLHVETESCSSTHQVDLSACLELSASDHAASAHWIINEDNFSHEFGERVSRAAKLLYSSGGDEVFALSIARPYHLSPVHPNLILPKLKQPVPVNKSILLMQLQLNNFIIDKLTIETIATAVPGLENLALIGCEVNDIWASLSLIKNLFHVGLNHCTRSDAQDNVEASIETLATAINTFGAEWSIAKDPSLLLELTVCPPYLPIASLSQLSQGFMEQDPVRVIFIYQQIFQF